MRKTVGHLPYAVVVPFPGVFRLSVMSTELSKATDLMHQLEVIFESKPALYLHFMEMQLSATQL